MNNPVSTPTAERPDVRFAVAFEHRADVVYPRVSSA